MKNIGKRIEKLKDSIEVNRVSALLLFAKVDEELNSLSVGELTGEQGLGLAMAMSALMSAASLLNKATEALQEIDA